MVTIGTALFAARLFVSDAPSAKSALIGFFVGSVLKWIVLLGGMVTLLALYQLPALPVVTGVCVALLSNLVAWRFKD